MKKHPFFLVLMNIQENGIPVGYFCKNIITKEAISRVETHFGIHCFSTHTSHFPTHSNVCFSHHNNNNQLETCLNIKKSFKIDYKCATSMNYSPESKSERHESIKEGYIRL